jgi:hypothetical protein
MDKGEIDSFAPELESQYARSEDIRRSCWLKTVALRTFWSTASSPKRLFQTRKDFPWFTTKMKTNPTTELETSNGEQLRATFATGSMPARTELTKRLLIILLLRAPLAMPQPKSSPLFRKDGKPRRSTRVPQRSFVRALRAHVPQPLRCLRQRGGLAPGVSNLADMCREFRIVRQDSIARLCEIFSRATHHPVLSLIFKRIASVRSHFNHARFANGTPAERTNYGWMPTTGATLPLRCRTRRDVRAKAGHRWKWICSYTHSE